MKLTAGDFMTTLPSISAAASTAISDLAEQPTARRAKAVAKRIDALARFIAAFGDQLDRELQLKERDR